MSSNKLNTFEKVIKCKESFDENPAWECIGSFEVYDGTSLADVDSEFVYYDASTGDAYQFIINFNLKYAYMRKLEEEELIYFNIGARN